MMWKSAAAQLLRSLHMLSLHEPFFAQHKRSMATVSAMQPHMRQSMADISQRMRSVDLVVEMRDARIPHTSANYSLINLIRGKPRRLLLLNKADIAHKRFRKETLRELSSSKQQVLYTCTSARGFAAEVLAAMRSCLASESQGLKTASITDATSSGNVHVIMVVGTPNVGKTSLINALRQHARKEGLLDVPRAGQLPVGSLPGVTKHVSGIKLSDNPTMLLIDTPGVMLPKLTASTFAYRVALAGLVQETQVELGNLFAFTLYVLAQPPNKSQLKAVLAEPIPTVDGSDSQGGQQKAGTQAALRWSYASKRIAKCTLQAIDETLSAYKTHASAEYDSASGTLTEDEHDVWSSNTQGTADVHTSADGAGVNDDINARLSLSSSQGSERPQRASEFLALISPGGETHTLTAPPTAPYAKTHSASTGDSEKTAQLSEIAVVIDEKRVVLRTSKGGWVQYESGLWSACAEILLRKLVKPNGRPVPGREPPEMQSHAAMSKVVKMVRDGHLGKLVFEEPRSQADDSRQVDVSAPHTSHRRKAGREKQNRT